MSTTKEAYRNAIRFYVNDSATTNVLIGAEESTDAKIDLAIDMVLSDFNMSIPWGGGYDYSSFPDFSLMIIGATIQLLRSAGILHSRNSLNYSAGGLSVQIWNKAKDYMAWINSLNQEYQANKRSIITKMNISRALDQAPMGLHTEYFLAGFRLPGLM